MCTRGGAGRGRGGAGQAPWLSTPPSPPGRPRGSGSTRQRHTRVAATGKRGVARGVRRGVARGAACPAKRRGLEGWAEGWARRGGEGGGEACCLQSELADLVGVQPVLRGEEDLVVLDDVPACTGTRTHVCSCAGLCAAERCMRGEVRGEVWAGGGATCQAGQLTLARPCPWNRAVSSTCSPSSPSPP